MTCEICGRCPRATRDGHPDSGLHVYLEEVRVEQDAVGPSEVREEELHACFKCVRLLVGSGAVSDGGFIDWKAFAVFLRHRQGGRRP